MNLTGLINRNDAATDQTVVEAVVDSQKITLRTMYTLHEMGEQYETDREVYRVMADFLVTLKLAEKVEPLKKAHAYRLTDRGVEMGRIQEASDGQQ